MECSEGPEKEGVSPWHPMRCEKEGRGMSAAAAAGKGKPAATADRESLVEVGPPLLGGGGASQQIPPHSIRDPEGSVGTNPCWTLT